MDGQFHKVHFLKILIGWTPSGPRFTCGVGGVDQKLHINIYSLSGQTFFQFTRSWFSAAQAQAFFDKTNYQQLLCFHIDLPDFIWFLG